MKNSDSSNSLRLSGDTSKVAPTPATKTGAQMNKEASAGKSNGLKKLSV